jgi:hypothetical protein
MENNITKYIEKLSTLDLVQDSKVSQKFVDLFNAIHGNKMGEAIYQKEQFNFSKLLVDNPELQNCSKLSLYGCFLDIAVLGLSLDSTSRPLCYVVPKSVKTGLQKDGKDLYEKRATLMVTGYGELVQRKRSGHINYADNPVIVYDCDTFQPSIDKNGNKTVEYSAMIPRTAKSKIIGAFIKIVRNDKSFDYQWLLEDDILRLQKYSEKANGHYDANLKKRVDGNSNALYKSWNGGIDPGFLENKMIKHAFDAYPKVRTGDFTQLETQVDEVKIDYNLTNKEDKESFQDAEDLTNKSFDAPPVQNNEPTITYPDNEF